MSEQVPDGSMIQNICTIGAGYVGGPTSAVIAAKNPHVSVHVVDKDQGRILAWSTDHLPVAEPGLIDIVKTGRDGSDGRLPNLTFSSNIEQAIQEAELIFIAVNTPIKSSGRGAHQALDIIHLESAVRTIARASTTHKIIVEKSTVPCGTAGIVRDMFKSLGRPGVRFDVLSNPEFLAEGTAISNLLDPDRILIGSEQDEHGLRAAQVLSRIYESWVSPRRIIAMNVQSAELAKLAANALLAQRISSINALSAICEETGADVEEVAKACGLDARIGHRMLKASLGFGGSCLKKDVLTLAHFSDSLGLGSIGSYWRSVNDINEIQKSRFVERIVRRMNNTLVDKKIAVLGCAFKKDTGDVRESPAIALLVSLLAERARISVYDPQVQAHVLINALSNATGARATDFERNMEICTSAYTACNDAQAVVIATEWDEFGNRAMSKAANGVPKDELSKASVNGEDSEESSKLDWPRIASNMRYPSLLFDGRNIVDYRELSKLGFVVSMIGKAN